MMEQSSAKGLFEGITFEEWPKWNEGARYREEVFQEKGQPEGAWTEVRPAAYLGQKGQPA